MGLTVAQPQRPLTAFRLVAWEHADVGLVWPPGRGGSTREALCRPLWEALCGPGAVSLPRYVLFSGASEQKHAGDVGL